MNQLFKSTGSYFLFGALITDIMMSLKSSSVIFDPRALASDHLLHMLIIKSVKSVCSE